MTDLAELWPEKVDPYAVDPLELLNKPLAYVVWRERVGGDEADRRVEEASRAAMEENGPRYALVIGEKMERAIMLIEEWTGVDPEDEDQIKAWLAALT